MLTIFKDDAEVKRAKAKAVRLVHRAIAERQLKHLGLVYVLCADCKTKRATDYDHRDYAKPLDVEPVCRGCNIRRGRGSTKRLDQQMTDQKVTELSERIAEKIRKRKALSNKPYCPVCGSTMIYFRRKTNDFACRGCGEIWKSKKQQTAKSL